MKGLPLLLDTGPPNHGRADLRMRQDVAAHRRRSSDLARGRARVDACYAPVSVLKLRGSRRRLAIVKPDKRTQQPPAIPVTLVSLSRIGESPWRLAMVRALVVVAFLSLGACGADRSTSSASSEFASEVKLAALLPAGAKPTGVTVSPEGKTYVLDPATGLYEVDARTAKLVFATTDLARFGADANLRFTDVAALGSERFAVTAENDGYVL